MLRVCRLKCDEKGVWLLLSIAFLFGFRARGTTAAHGQWLDLAFFDIFHVLTADVLDALNIIWQGLTRSGQAIFESRTLLGILRLVALELFVNLRERAIDVRRR